MGNPKQTAVNLTESAQKIKIEWAPIYGLKKILSAGLLLFDRLSAQEQISVIAEVSKANPNNNGDEQKQSIKAANGMNIDEPGVEQLKAGLKFANKAGFSETINILNAEEREAVRQLRRALGPAAKHGKTKGEKTG